MKIAITSIIILLIFLALAAWISRNNIESRFENKIVYSTFKETAIDPFLKLDCAIRGGTFSTCGSACSPNAEACILICARTCEFDK